MGAPLGINDQALLTGLISGWFHSWTGWMLLMLPIGAVFGVLTTRGLLKRIHRPLYPAAAPAEKITGASRLASCPVLPPGGEVGGDLFDFLKLPGGRLGIVIGDVTDKGVPAALVMATTCTMLRATGFPLA